MTSKLPNIPIAKPWIGPEEKMAVIRPLESGWLTQGPEVLAFEQEFAAAVGSAHACAVSSCTTALHLALKAVGVGSGDEVITVSHSFIATANSIRYVGGVPIFVDIDPDTFNLDPKLLEGTITDRTRAILIVHQMGMPCDLSSILSIARKLNIPVIEDAACAAGSEIRWNGVWERIGKPRGDIACFSFHPRKIITTGDGGMLTTANAEWDAKFRLWRQHGMSVTDLQRHQNRVPTRESYDVLGYNYRMTDLQAAVGREQLRKLPEIIRLRRALADRYVQELKSLKQLYLPPEPEWARSNWQSYCVRLEDGVDRDGVIAAMREAGIASKGGIMCAHREPAYSAEPWKGRHLAQSELAQDRCILLPLYAQMTGEEQDRVISALGSAVR